MDLSPYSNREIDERFKAIAAALTRIEAQTIKHNGRMTRMERVLLIVGTAVVVLLVVNGSPFVSLLMSII